MFFGMALAMTALEYIAGLMSLKVMHLRLWDYSHCWGNIQGLICPLFTFFWGVLAALYYFLLYPPLRKLVVWFVAHPLFSFIVGVCFGIFLIDFAVSLHLGTALRKRAVEFDKSVESIDLQAIQRRLQKRGGFFRFTSIKPLTERIDAFDEFLHRKPGKNATAAK